MYEFGLYNRKDKMDANSSYYCKDGKFYVSIPERTIELTDRCLVFYHKTEDTYNNRIERNAEGKLSRRKVLNPKGYFLVYYEYDYMCDDMVPVQIRVSEPSYTLVQDAYIKYWAEYDQKYEKKKAEKKAIDDYNKKHPSFAIAGNSAVTNPWKKK